MYVQEDNVALRTALCNESVEFVVLTEALFAAKHIKYISNNICIIEHYVSVYESMYIYAPTKEAAALTVFMAWLRA